MPDILVLSKHTIVLYNLCEAFKGDILTGSKLLEDNKECIIQLKLKKFTFIVLLSQ
jgi:hypothetical protein